MFNNHLAYSKFLINISQDSWVCCFFFLKEIQLYKTDKIDITAQAIITSLRKLLSKPAAEMSWGTGSGNFLTQEALSWNIALLKDNEVSSTADTPFPLCPFLKPFLDVRPH